MKLILNAIRGFCMAVADSVPGVSGGTIAFLMGFYDQFINSLDGLFLGNKEEKKKSLLFLVKLGIGWVIGLGISIAILTSLFSSHIYVVSSVFLGLTCCAIPIVIREERESVIGHYKNILFLVLGVAAVVLITLGNPSSGGGLHIDVSNLTLGNGIYVFLVGMLAISAMVLPGISGSTMLLIFGLYIPVTTAIKAFMKGDPSNLKLLVILALGIIAGILVIIRLVKFCLHRFRSQTIYFIIGLMAGSLLAIVKGPETLDIPQKALDLSTFHIGGFILGVAILVVFEIGKTIKEKKEA